MYNKLYKTAVKMGYLEILTKKKFPTFKKHHFFVLSFSGLYRFKKPGEVPRKVYPIIGSKIIDVKGGLNNFQIKILFEYGSIPILLSMKSKIEKEEWVKAFNKIMNCCSDL